MVKMWFAATMALICLCVPALGQALADRVPADAVLYVGWSGSDAMTGDYARSNLKKLVDQTSFQQNMENLIPLALARLEKDLPRGGQEMAMFKSAADLLPILWHRPCALYFGGASMNPQGAPSVKFAIICDGGGNPAGVLKTIQEIADKTHAPIRADLHSGRYISISAVYPLPDAVSQLLDGQGGQTLANNPAFKSAIAKTASNGAMTFYLDSASFTAQVEGIIDNNAPQAAKTIWKTVKAAYAPDGVKRVVMTCGFDGADWATRLYIEAPAPRKGIASWLESDPLSADLLKQFPADSTYAAGTRLNLNNMVYTGLSIASLFQPTVQQQFNRTMREIQTETGVHVQDDLLTSLGEEWGVFMSPSAGGDTALGLVVVNRLADPAKFNEAVAKLETYANKELENQSKRIGSISIKTVKAGAHEVHYLTIPFAAPAFVVRDGTLYASLYPQSLIGALEYADAGGKGISDNPKFATIQKRLGATNPSSFSFMDLPALAPDSYGILLAAERTAAGFMDMYGIPMPEPMLPTLPQIMKVISPSGSVAWQDDTGIYRRSVTPFPMANLLGTQAGSLTLSLPVLAGVALPAVSKSREQAMRVACMTYLKQIGTAIEMYKADNNKMPPTLGDLVSKGIMTAQVMSCPKSGKVPPPGMNPEQAAKWVNDNTDYVYLGEGLKKDMKGIAQVVIVHERPGNHPQGVNVLFGDGHVEWCTLPRLEPVLALSKMLRDQAK